MKRALQVASVASMIEQFNMDNIIVLQKMGYAVDVASNFDFGSTSSQQHVEEFKNQLNNKTVHINNLLFSRKILNISNIHAYRKSYKMMI